MTLNLTLLLLKVVVTITAGKYVHIPFSLTWFEAQSHCRVSYTDLAPVSTAYDQSRLNKMVSNRRYTWIGLMRNRTDRERWMWSGGAEVSETFWGHWEPSDITTGEDAGMIHNNAWADTAPYQVMSFICYKVHAVRKRMTWDDALQYCRKNHHDLASVASETELMLIGKELGKDLSSYDVWIGLQFMDANWQWMDGQSFTFESWGPLEKPICPDITFACGALRVQGPGQTVGKDTLANVSEVLGWNALDCNWKLHFLCY